MLQILASCQNRCNISKHMERSFIWDFRQHRFITDIVHLWFAKPSTCCLWFLQMSVFASLLSVCFWYLPLCCFHDNMAGQALIDRDRQRVPWRPAHCSKPLPAAVCVLSLTQGYFWSAAPHFCCLCLYVCVCIKHWQLLGFSFFAADNSYSHR